MTENGKKRAGFESLVAFIQKSVMEAQTHYANKMYIKNAPSTYAAEFEPSSRDLSYIFSLDHGNDDCLYYNTKKDENLRGFLVFCIFI